VTVSNPDARLPVNVRGDLRVDSPSGATLRLHADGNQLFLAVPRWAELDRLGPRSMMARRRALVDTIRHLRTLGLAMTIDVAGRRALGIGDGVKTTLLARMLGIRSADLRFSSVVNALKARALGRR
jgi:hypothetical protein